MKELTIEEKAKAYDNALERARKLQENSNGMILKKWLWNIFPALKESEDERIRKGIIRNLEYLADRAEGFVKDELKERIAWLEKQGKQKPTDKVEPKFHEGEWIVHHGTENIYQVVAVAVIDKQYLLKYGNNYTIQKCADVDICARLWDITKDAKKCDVLSDGTTIFIFKDLLSDGSVMSYCDYDPDSSESDAFCPLSVNLMCSKITLATKEQRDLLFQKMKEAGYEWDADKKELKMLITNGGDFDEKNCDQKPVKENKGNLGGISSNSAWSEDGKAHVNSIIGYMLDYKLFVYEEDMNVANGVQKELDWLKSLKERYTWKPSDEQINTLSKYAEQNNKDGSMLTSLYQDLKKLKN